MRFRAACLLSAALVLCLPLVSAGQAAAPDHSSRAIKLPTVVKWMLQASEPCPNCDAAQTWVGRKPTPLPSPLPRDRKDATEEVHGTTPVGANGLDELTWEQVRLLLPTGLRRID